MSEFTIGHKRMAEYFRTLHFTFTPLVYFMVSAHAYPTSNISDTVQLNCWQRAKLELYLEIPYCPQISSLTLRLWVWERS